MLLETANEAPTCANVIGLPLNLFLVKQHVHLEDFLVLKGYRVSTIHLPNS